MIHYKIHCRFLEKVGKNRVKEHRIDTFEDTPFLAIMVAERFLDTFTEKCHGFELKIEGVKNE